MKFYLVVILAFLAGCNANVEKQSQLQLDTVKDAFWDYVAKATSTAEDSLATIKQSDFGKEINTLIASSGDAVTRLTAILRSHMSPDFSSGFSEEARLLKTSLEKDLESVAAHLRPYADEWAAQLRQELEQLKKEASSYADSVDSEALKSVLLQNGRELKTRLDLLKGQMVPYAEELARKLEVGLEGFHGGLTEIREKLGPYGEEIRAKLDLDSRNLRERLVALWDSFAKTAVKVDELDSSKV
ncbi:apolipoprotein A-IV a [Stigmatopora nigra]